MLDSFRSTAQAMSDTTTLKEAMHVLLERVQQELTGCECSIFLVDPDQEDFVLIDTSRTKDILPGQCRIPKGEGLVSWVAEKAEPIILEDALSHPANIE
ncbi:MAG: hypothetical protein EBX40_04490, partial [Gammaproteobacteria bacterium]|nr:hypothetical protein [Gammaproteobacteria bacterium]